MRLHDLPDHVQQRLIAAHPDLARSRARTPGGHHSELEETLAGQLRQLRLPSPDRQHRFDPLRRWRFDLAWPDLHVAVEVDGGTHTGGRHVRAAGYENDCEKLNAATMAGWQVLRFTAAMVSDGRAATTTANALALAIGTKGTRQ